MIIDAVIPAYNEASTIAGVIAPVIDAGVINCVIVVDDGSSDGTADVAREAAATVLRMPRNGGKGAAMRAGVRASRADAIAFFDADLIGLRPAHVRQLVEPVAEGRAVMSCGLRDYGHVYNTLQESLPPITGERVVLRRLLERVPPEFWVGFRIEAGINEVVARSGGPVERVVLYGMTMRPKWQKTNVRRGLEQGVNMLVEVLTAMRDARRMP